MRNLKEKSRLLVLCLPAILLLNGISLAGGHGGHHISGGFHGRSFSSRFSPFYGGIPFIIGPYSYGSNDYYTYHSRYDNFPYSTGSRYDNFPNPSSYDNYQSRYDNFPYSSQAQSPQPQGNTYNNSNNTYNYTYNYYGGAEGSTAQYGSVSSRSASPQKSEVGIYYENGVVAFKDGHYAAAADNFQRAIRQANKFMPLAYTQALFANGNYTGAAEQLRLAIDKYSPENDRILFPGFLYPSNLILLNQIEKLRGQADINSDLQLLVGYQLFGVKKFDDAAAYLNKAKTNPVNEPAAAKLLSMMKKAVTTGPLAINK
ncbi:MAG: hypothetical protein ABSE89_06625 [Sedimentisphaerales bacterium]